MHGPARAASGSSPTVTEATRLTGYLGSRSATLCHLANFGYDFREELTFDPAKWRFVGNEEANKRLDYQERRKGFELPKID